MYSSYNKGFIYFIEVGRFRGISYTVLEEEITEMLEVHNSESVSNLLCGAFIYDTVHRAVWWPVIEL